MTTLHEVEENGTVYLKLSASETYWLLVDAAGTDQLELDIDLTVNPPNGEEIVSGQFVVQSADNVDVFAWDYRNRLTSVTRYVAVGGGTPTSFELPGGRSATLNEAFTKHYVYDVQDRLAYEYRTDCDAPTEKYNERVFLTQGSQRVAVFERSGTDLEARHLMLPDPTSDRMLAEEYIIDATTSHTIWPMHDHQGTVVAAFSASWHPDPAVKDIQHFDYDAFGVPKFDPEQDPSLANRLVSLHTGRDWDSDIELYYNRARWYDPASGRFISEDPIRFLGGDANLYRYVGNSPANATDPSGMIWGWGLAAGGAAIGAVSYVGISLLTGHEMCWQEFTGAAVGGAVAGLVAGALTGDATSAVGLIGIGLVSGAAGGATTSLVTQELKTGTVDLSQLGRDTAFGALGGAVGAGLGVAFSRVAPTIFQHFTGPSGPSFALAGGGMLGSGATVAGALSAATTQSIVRGLTVAGSQIGIAYSMSSGNVGDSGNPKEMRVGDSGHHVPAVRKASGRPFEVNRSDKTCPTIHVRGDESAQAQAHWRMHNAELEHIGPRQGDFVGTDEELFSAYRRSYAGLNDIRVDVRSPNGTHILAEDITPVEAVDVIERFLSGK